MGITPRQIKREYITPGFQLSIKNLYEKLTIIKFIIKNILKKWDIRDISLPFNNNEDLNMSLFTVMIF